jgi:hypothetical protein
MLMIKFDKIGKIKVSSFPNWNGFYSYEMVNIL